MVKGLIAGIIESGSFPADKLKKYAGCFADRSIASLNAGEGKPINYEAETIADLLHPMDDHLRPEDAALIGASCLELADLASETAEAPEAAPAQ